ncbi:MAG: LPS export ABC transporter periplasmic protein LptC [Crocinitomicaceae bacterium]|nr:LPS export ABC transporter periplasmic protein LptC [Crocinitomicaceae bacterium]MBK8927970.1 LPS export ABC transporter periplasmic protein LptC [Crocinitomicaceae bacterium]
MQVISKYNLSVICSVLLISFLMLSSCENDLENVKLVTATDESPDQVVNNVHSIYSDRGDVRFEIIATRMEVFSNPEKKTVFKNGFQANFFKSKDSLEATLTADYAEMMDESNSLFARSKVILTNFDKKQTLKTEELYWDQKAKRIRTEKAFEIIGENSYVSGYGMDANETFSDYNTHNVTAEWTKKEEK